jgi:Domain of unknown function (DUF4062)
MPILHHTVMISSTYVELTEHRAAVSQAALGLGMRPLDMANDSALPGDLIEESLAKVEEADIYIGLISYRYGQIPDDPRRNPDGLSLTELEYRRAVKRGIPRGVFIMHDDHTPGIPRSAVLKELATRDKLEAFIALVRNDSICAEFASVADLKAKAVQTLAVLKEKLGRGTVRSGPSESAIPAPPAFYAQPPYLPGNKFQGRASELTAMRDWAGGPEPMMLFEAIGGMGKSMVTWEWVTNHAAQERGDWAGRFWYSFYERGTDMGDFCATALAYITGQSRRDLVTRPRRELEDDLLFHLRQRPWLLVLDGLERVLAAYNRSDAAQLADEDADDSLGATGKSPTDCIRPGDDEFLAALRTAAPSKLLISSRLMPRALLNRFGQPVQEIRHLSLRGLDPRDAEQMLRDAGIDGDADRMRRYLDEKFGCHPLLVGIAGGLVLKYMKAPGHFDRWVDDPLGGGAMNLADPDIKQRRNHILKLAFDGLDNTTRELLSRIAMISTAVDWDVLVALNPAPPAGPAAEAWLNTALADLATRGLLQCDQHSGTFDLHPVVRGYAVASLSAKARAETGQRVADYFSARPEPAYATAESLQDLATPMQIVQTLNLAGKTKEAWAVLNGDLRVALHRLERHHEVLALLRPLFPRGWLARPEGVDDPGFVASEAGIALDGIGLRAEATAQEVFAIQEGARKGVTTDLSIRLRNHAETAWGSGGFVRAKQILTLARAVAAAAGDANRTLWCDLFLVDYQRSRGALAEARASWTGLADRLPKETRNDAQLEANALRIEASLLFDEGALTAEFLGAAINRTHALRRPFLERALLSLSGDFHLANARPTEAEAAFARAIEMARAAGLSDTDAEAGRGLALARLNRREDAEAVAASAERDPPHAPLAELYLALGEPDKARHHALAGYKWYWHDGPRYTDHWDLQRCRAVLEQLHEPVPDMPPYDPAKQEPIPFEADIRRLLKEHEAKQKPKQT